MGEIEKHTVANRKLTQIICSMPNCTFLQFTEYQKPVNNETKNEEKKHAENVYKSVENSPF